MTYKNIRKNNLFLAIAVIISLSLIFVSTVVLAEQGQTCGNSEWFCSLTNQCVKKGETCCTGMAGGCIDEHGCNPTAGYSWCESKQKCLRIWEESCPTPTPTPTISPTPSVSPITSPIIGASPSPTPSPTPKNKGQTIAEQHRSAVANFVQSLLNVADREGGIGEQVRLIAQQQNQSTETTVQAMEQVQNRNKIKTFLFGSDYKNLGALRGKVVQTRNRLEQLNKLMENVQNEGDQTELQNQIQTLEQEQTNIENFIKAQESKFSLFGWLLKFFNK